jgi:peptide/nickel transport system substrate-binding protein
VRISRRVLASIAFAVLVVPAFTCAPRPIAGNDGGSAPQALRVAPPRILTVGRMREPAYIEGFIGGVSFANEVRDFVHDYLTVQNYRDETIPQLAAELPAAERGTWLVKPDGTMDVTRLRPNIRWHDGTPFTSDDMAFSYQLYKDPEHSSGATAMLNQMIGVDAPDPLTYVVHYSRADARALQAEGLVPLPRHVLEPIYVNDRPNFINSPKFSNEWVGLGPYKIARWEPGSHLELERFDDYFLGRPPLDRVIIRFFFDTNAMSTAMLAEGFEVAIPGGIDLDSAVAIRDRWAGTGNIVRIEAIPRITDMEIQYRPELSRPVNGLRDRTVRQAFFQAINREQLMEVMTLGLGAVADSWFPPNDPNRAAVEPFIPRYPFDPQAALRLLADAGWTRGPDGILVHTSGERFVAELRTIPQYGEKPAVVIASNWKDIGADMSVWAIPQARASERELNASQTFAKVNGSYLDALFDRLDSRLIASASNRWTGRNLSGWGNPRYDEILDRLAVTIDHGERFDLLKEQMQIVMGDIARFPLYWEPRPILALKSVKADLYPYNTTWNVFEWDKQ